MGLTPGELTEFIRCPLTYERYLESLLQRGHIGAEREPRRCLGLAHLWHLHEVGHEGTGSTSTCGSNAQLGSWGACRRRA